MIDLKGCDSTGTKIALTKEQAMQMAIETCQSKEIVFNETMKRYSAEIDSLRIANKDLMGGIAVRVMIEEKLRIATETLASIAANHKPECGDARHWNDLPSAVLSLTIVEDTMIAREALAEIEKVV